MSRSLYTEVLASSTYNTQVYVQFFSTEGRIPYAGRRHVGSGRGSGELPNRRGRVYFLRAIFPSAKLPGAVGRDGY